MSATILEESPDALRQAADALAAGQLVVAPSRTNYALICDAENPVSIENVYTAKARTKFGPLTLAVPMIDDVARYVEFPNKYGLPMLHRIWPAEISFIYRLIYPLPPRMVMGTGTIAVMFQRPCALNRLLAVYSRPVALTSANLSGQGNIVVTKEKALEDMQHTVDVILVNDYEDERVDVVTEGLQPSNTIVDFTFSKPFLVRDGCYPLAQLHREIPELNLDINEYKKELAYRIRWAQATGSQRGRQ